MLDLIKIEDQTGNCREIYKDKNTNRLYSRHINDRASKGVYVNHWNTFTGEPDCPLKDGTRIKINDQLFTIKRDSFTDWAIEKEYKIQVTAAEFQSILSENNLSLVGLNNYEIIPDFNLTGNKIIDSCLHSRVKDDNSILYYGGHICGDCYTFQRIVNKDYNTSCLFVDGYRAVLADNEAYNIYTYCEGDITVNTYKTIDDYQVAITEAIEFYENN